MNKHTIHKLCLIAVILVIAIASTSTITSAVGQNKNCDSLHDNPDANPGGPWPKDVGPYYFEVGDKVKFIIGGLSWAIIDINITDTATYIVQNAPLTGGVQVFTYVIPATGWYEFTVDQSDWDPGSHVTVTCK